MAVKRVFEAQSVSAAPVLHFAEERQGSVSAGLSGEGTFSFEPADRFRIPIGVRDTRISVNGTFGSGSASAVLAIDISPDASAGVWFNLFSVSASFTSVIPMHAGHALRFNLATVSAAFSIDAWVG